MPLISFDDMKKFFSEILIENGMAVDDAQTCAEIFAVNSLEGVYTHGANRFSRFIEYIQQGHIDVHGKPIMVHAVQGLEQWDGQLGPGPLNAMTATNRAMALAKEKAIGCVALSHTNHWMRGGYYAWHAAKSNCLLIAWTNTIGNLPAWGAIDQRLGNNPFVMGVPYRDEAIVLDMAMSQFSYGKIEMQSRQNKTLPVPGGFDEKGKLTTDASAILSSNRMLPAGYWKGAGMSLLLDIVAMVLSGGNAVHQVTASKIEGAVSQVFVAIDITKLHHYPGIQSAIDLLIEDYLQSQPADEKEQIMYPGQRVIATRKANMQQGIPVEEDVWKNILSLRQG